MSECTRGGVSLSELRQLGVEIPAGADLATVRSHVEATIVRLATSPSAAFDRPRYERLMHLWEAMTPEQGAGVDAV